MRMLSGMASVLLTGAALAPAAAGQEAALAKVYVCADVENAAQRHACFDALVPDLKAAQAAGAITLKPQQQAETFGKAAPRQSALTAPVKTADAPKPVAPPKDQVDRVRLAFQSISTGSDGKFRFTMENGQIWRQLDTERLRNLGSGPWTAEIRKAALGSFLLTIGGAGAIRVERMN